MDNSFQPRLSQITKTLFFGTLLVISMMVYLVENFTNVDAGAVKVKTAVITETITTTLFTQTNPAYGLNRISNSEQDSVPEAQYQAGLSTGATWDRWPLYWSRIETVPGVFNWTFQDTAVTGVISHGLKLNAILLGTPPMYTTTQPSKSGEALNIETPGSFSPMTIDQIQTGVPQGLYEPVFTDGDEPGDGKTINSENVWARFVETAVNRYKPGGEIAQQEGWAAGIGVTHWEMWNEPDLTHFWDGTVEDYARLLKVGYLAAKHADPEAQVIFGGLADVYSDPYDIPYLTEVLEHYDDDPLAQNNNYFHDIIAVHNYSYAKRSWKAIYVAKQRLDARNLDNEVWLNESGVPVWNDYPGPVCDPTSAYRATMQEQADFVIQSALYARVNGADKIFFFSLYDECGNAGGNPDYFPADQCKSNPPPATYAGDAFGLFRNPSDSASLCSTEHPNPGTPRPSLAAYQVLTQYFVNVDWIWRAIPGVPGSGNGLQEFIAFYQPHTRSRVLGMWALTDEPATAVFNSTNSSQTALLVAPDGITQTIYATNGVFSVTLPAATSHITPSDVYAGVALMAIGGTPYLVIEQDDVPPTISASAPLTTTIGTTVTVSWQGDDLGSGMASYDVTISHNGNPATPWLTATTDLSAPSPVFSEGGLYTFTVYGRDQAGNISLGAVVDVSTDTSPPIVSITAPITATAGTTVVVSWQGEDEEGSVVNYDVTMAFNGNPATPWLTATTELSATSPVLSEEGIYTFTIYGRDQSGNVSAGTSVHIITAILDNHIYLPTIHK